MVNQKTTVISKLSKLFKGKTDPEKMRHELRNSIANLDESLYGLEYDLKKMRRDREKIIQKGVRAAKDGDAILKQEAAFDLKSMNAELAYVQQNRSGIVKSKMLCRMSLRRLTSAMPGGAMEASKGAMVLLQDDELNDLLTDRECNEERFQDLIDRKVGTMTRGIEGRAIDSEMEISSEANLFDELAAAEQKGDADAVSEIMSQMTGEKKGSKDFDSLI